MPFIDDRWHRRFIAKPNILDPCSCLTLCGIPHLSSQPKHARIRPIPPKPLSVATFREMSIRQVPSVAAA